MLPSRLRNSCVVAVNEYNIVHSFLVGHLDITFFFHGTDQGTYGFNISGKDASGKRHGKTGLSLELRGPKVAGHTIPMAADVRLHGGTFIENNSQAYVHYVIVSEKNYHSMPTFAKSQAEQTVRHGPAYKLLSFNCVDFVYRVFQHSDLSPDDKDVDRYVSKVWLEPVGWYSRLRELLL